MNIWMDILSSVPWKKGGCFAQDQILGLVEVDQWVLKS